MNTGNCNTGDRNTGSWNTGSWNTGSCNTGNCNTGNCNTGDMNAGNWNTGNYNTGDMNAGNWNTGNYNTGDCNTGDWNTGACNTGCFNTGEQKIIMFDKPSDWTYSQWIESNARYLLNKIPTNVVEWVCSSNMTDEEKAAHPTHETVGGYLKILDESECAQIWWDGLRKDERETILHIPNFDPGIFLKCTGINVGNGEE